VPRLGLGLFLWIAACASVQSAAQRDPMRCERDPNCVRARGAYPDCDRQCNDDPECVDRCKGMQADPGLSHH
jgi:hypothetical protein